MSVKVKGRPPKPMEERFWSKVQKQSNGCWLFTSVHGGTAYGMLSVKEGEYLAHRISWVLHYGEIPQGTLVLHKCDVPKCVNPDHLFLGTHRDNSDDKLSKKRHRFGESSPITPFTEKDVLKIRELYASGKLSQQKIANMYGVNQTAISAIVRRATWKHI
jgi:DNA-binding XRE family transcriptional regulator